MAAVPLTEFAVHLRPQDNIAVCRRPIPANTDIAFDGGDRPRAAAIRMGHKFAVRPIKEGDPILKYGQIIGFAEPGHRAGRARPRPQRQARHLRARLRLRRQMPAAAAAAGRVPHLHGLRPRRRQARPPALRHAQLHRGHQHRQLLGQHEQVHRRARSARRASSKNFPNVDGIVAIMHRQGCAMQYDGPDHKQLDRTLAGFARHPNVAAYILVGLGCEIGQASHLIEQEQLNLIQLNGAKSTPLVLSIQECGGIGKTVEAGVKAVAELLPRVNDVRRVAAAGASTSSSAPTAAAPTATAASPPTRRSASPPI